ncbi:hypothetical protein RHMOL_Rhmol02G0014300 [Rhododendron molle]|uniref:Uncharacterized protein n=1 Tax=Rhododendron molle TaxID=49168 RepID=A0ACC0PN16_RHOML|nr:hypothetical protein RHMOL_Rhmol02G0014300 [Rhododendron molle]
MERTLGSRSKATRLAGPIGRSMSNSMLEPGQSYQPLQYSILEVKSSRVCYAQDMYRKHLFRTMDPTTEWYFRTYIDVSEFGFWRAAFSLVPLTDCLNAVYVDGCFAGVDGKPVRCPK